MASCFSCKVSGHVQGVFYQASSRHEAERLGISGYARNLRSGSVEERAWSEKNAVEDLGVWRANGP